MTFTHKHADQTGPHEPDVDGHNGVFGPPTIARSYGPPVIIEGPYRRVPDYPPLPPYQQPDWHASMNPAMAPDFRDELARLDGVITPGVDNTPFIQYAVEALTRDRDTGYSTAAASGTGSFSSGLILPQSQQPQPYSQQHRPAQQQPPPVRAPLPAHPPVSRPAEATRPDTQPQHLPRPFIPGPRESAQSLAETLLKKGPRPPQPHEWRPIERDELVASGRELPPLTFRPWPLRAPALFALMTVCILMIAALGLSAVYSHTHQGLIEWVSLYGGRYYLFRILPQLLAAFILLYAQFVITTMFRMLPFVRLASEKPEDRDGALFQELYPSFLWPRLVGPWNVWVPVLVTWLISFTIPLQSSLFTVILVDQTWTWATVQGVAWTLVALYLALLASTVIVWRYWASLDTTGLIWDPRSLADIAALVSETNTAEDYRGTQLARSRDGIRFALRRRAADRLCYWTWRDGRHGFWHTLGSPMEEAHLTPIPDLAAGHRMQRDTNNHNEKHALFPTAAAAQADDDHPDLEASHPAPHARHRYLPSPCAPTRSSGPPSPPPSSSAIFIASFPPPPASPRASPPGAFSPADFFFAFLPSLLGTVVFLAFQPLDTPCASSNPGPPCPLHQTTEPEPEPEPAAAAPAARGLLADYAACAPGQCTLRALRNGHWRVAAVSLLAALFALIPVLAGGSFMALTTSGGEVRMFANTPAYGVLLGLLVLYVLALAALFPGRRALRMPHAVTCLAEIVGYLVSAEMREEAAFKRCVSRREMVERMGEGDMQTWWEFGFDERRGGGAGGGGDGELGVRRLRRFTEKRRVRKSQIRRPQVRRPLL
ncbi:hypothetical protein NEMBOFW57_001821 [Staphylotrichum longicolle]|uniref:Phosphoribosylaminoimidazole-succinocarboxamide synthase n=1 Tax=Staphylotrichum longicolle TaxID=669026 RepID=A0AAD4F325_9PEZI|nr:hypothetical protein NEMBOFW57_001821 [Staphylotrichum longicolle]